MCPQHDSLSIKVNRTNGAQPRKRIVRVLHLFDLLPIARHRRLIPIRAHITLIVPDRNRLRNPPVIIQTLIYDTPRLGQHTVRMRLPCVVVDRVQDAMRDVVAERVGRGIARRQATRRTRQAADGRVDDLADVLAERREHGVEIEAVEHVSDHAHDVFQPGLQYNVGADVLDQQLDAVDGRGDAGVEVEEREHLRVEVDFRGQVRDGQVDFVDGDGGVEENVGRWVGGADVGGGGVGGVGGGLGVTG